jgi:hypothetical protein
LIAAIQEYLDNHNDDPNRSSGRRAPKSSSPRFAAGVLPFTHAS